MKLSEIANIIGADLTGNPELEIRGPGKIETSSIDQITFISNPLYKRHYKTTKAGAIIVSKDFVFPTNRDDISILKVKDPYFAFVKLLELFEVKRIKNVGISSSSVIAEGVVVGKDVYIDDFVKIGVNTVIGENTEIHSNVSIGFDVVIGNNCVIESNVSIYNGSILGNNVTVHSGTVVGSDGFGFAKDDKGTFKKILQSGIVKIEDEVEIGSNCTIDRATIGETILRRGVKLDNQIQIAHNVEIDEDTVIAAQVGIAGSTKIGKRCMIGGQAGIVGHLTICDDVIIGASVGVAKSITQPGVYTGYRSKPMREALKDEVNIKEIPKLKERIKKLEDKNK
ncbi:MAG: UDP-3-O-(3-hydroxymyristoyl)glucosamine N-acyltransferase [Ignavibacteria bacterium]